MATAASITNVVQLPTAARRQVQQRWNKQTRHIAGELRKEWPGEYLPPCIRAKLPDAELLLDNRLTPEQVAVMAIFETMEPEAKLRALNHLRLCAMAIAGTASATALALLRPRSFGDQVNLDAAMNHLRGER